LVIHGNCANSMDEEDRVEICKKYKYPGRKVAEAIDESNRGAGHPARARGPLPATHPSVGRAVDLTNGAGAGAVGPARKASCFLHRACSRVLAGNVGQRHGARYGELGGGGLCEREG